MEKDIKKNTKLTLLVGILILIVIITTSTYAYYKTRIKSPGSKISIMGSNFSLNITDNSLVASNLTPIYDKNKETQGVKKEFTISIGSAGVTSACYDLYIDVTSLGENLRNKYFKYELTNGTDTYTGSFNGRTDGSQILIIRNQNINNTNTSNSYTLYLWLSYSETEDQTDILSGDSTSRTFKGRILAKAVTGTCKESDTDPTTYMANLLVINGSADAVKKEVLKNGTVVFTITPKEGYTLEDATINCENGVLEGNKLTITNMQSDTTCVIQLGEDGPYATGTLASQILKNNPVIKVRTDFTDSETGTTNMIFVESSTSTAQYTEDVDGDGIGEDTYYFSGDNENNWVKFGVYSTTKSKYWNEGEDIYWRIIRVNEDGSVRLLYMGSKSFPTAVSIGSEYATHFTNLYGYSTGIFYNSTYMSISNKNTMKAGYVKTKIDAWYKENLLTNYDKYISKTAIYCHDHSFYKNSSDVDYNGAYGRVSNNRPSFRCNGNPDGGLYETSGIQDENDKLSGSTTGGGNGKLYCSTCDEDKDYGVIDRTVICPVALMTKDEIMYAGLVESDTSPTDYKANKHYYNTDSDNNLGIGNWWTLSPRTSADSSKGMYGSSAINSDGLLRPVISLKACVKYSSGDGTPTNPYQVTIDSTCATAEN